MNRMFSLMFLVLTVSSQAMAWTISCTNGDFEKMGDGFYQIDILEDGIEFMPYETGFTLDAADVIYSAGTFSILNKDVTKSSEGTEWKANIDAILVLSEDNTKLNVAISDDNSAFKTYEMTCTQK